MGEDLHDIDKLFKAALEEHLEEPSEKVWEQLDRNLERKKVISITDKYRRWKWVAAALFIFSAGMAFYTIQLRKKYGQIIVTNKQSEKNKAAVTNKNKSNFNIKQPDKSEMSKIDRIHLKEDSLTDKMVNKINVKNNRNSRVAETEGIVQKAQPSAAGTQTVSGASPDFVRNTRQKTHKQKQLVDLKTNFNKTFLASQANKLQKKEYPKIVDLQSISRLNAADFKTDSFANVAAPFKKPLNEIISAAKKLIKIPKAKPAGFSATIFFSADAASADFKEGHPDYREDDRHELRRSENENTGSTFGVQLQKGISKNISLVTGLAVTNRTSDIHPKTLFARPDDNGNINYRISCSAGYAFIDSKAGASPASGDSVMALFSSTNTQYINIPLGLQYRFNFGRLSINPTALLAANIKTKGTIETLLKNAPTTSQSTIQGLRNMYLEGALKLDITYGISRSLGVSLFPTTRFGITSITNNSPVKTFVNTLGLGAGLQFSF